MISMLFFFSAVRRILPQFTEKPKPVYEVMPGQSLNITCVANGSPTPYVQWKKVSLHIACFIQ